jgi:hypothetical protein
MTKFATPLAFLFSTAFALAATSLYMFGGALNLALFAATFFYGCAIAIPVGLFILALRLMTKRYGVLAHILYGALSGGIAFTALFFLRANGEISDFSYRDLDLETLLTLLFFIPLGIICSLLFLVVERKLKN